MGRNTSVSLGHHFDTFIEEKVTMGRYQNTSEVIRAGLRLLEEEENRIALLSSAIKEGINSGIASDFDPQKHLKGLKATKKKPNG
jgi:antitoxin ParD1/3/4